MRSLDASTTKDRRVTTLRLHGVLTIDDAQVLRDEIARVAGTLERGRTARFDLSDVEQADGAAIAALLQSQAALQRDRVKVEFLGANAGIAELLAVYSGGAVRTSTVRKRSAEDVLTRVGGDSVELLRQLQSWFAFVGATFLAAARALRSPRQQNWRAVPALMERAGAGAAPIVLVINFFLGIVAAYEYGLAVAPLGATIYAPVLVGLSITRELGPLMTAIVVAGRTGAAFSLELGTTRVADEIEALRAHGLDPIGFLVLPRMSAIVLTLPLLTLMADCGGILGGLLVATLSQDMSGAEYLRQIQSGVAIHDIVFGLSKSAAFGLAIAFIACRQGLAASGAYGVGRRTAATVVSILLATVFIDALFARGS